MDLAAFKKVMETYGEDSCIAIIYDNVRTIVINEKNPDGTYKKFSEVVKVDEENECLVYRHVMINCNHIKDPELREAMSIDHVTPIENIQGFQFIVNPKIRDYYDLSIL